MVAQKKTSKFSAFIPGKWKIADSLMTQQILFRAANAFPSLGLNETKSPYLLERVAILKPDFYSNLFLLELVYVNKDNGEKRSVHFLYGKDHITLIDGSVGILNYDFNLENLILETDQQYISYLDFFCSVVWGGPVGDLQYRFRIVHSNDDLGIEAKYVPEHLIKYPITPSKIIEADSEYIEGGGKIIEAFIVYQNSLFKGEFHVFPDGTVQMIDDQVLWNIPFEGKEKFFSPWRSQSGEEK